MALTNDELMALSNELKTDMRLPLTIGDRVSVALLTVDAVLAQLAARVSLDKPDAKQPETPEE
jgi:hypothetical protein